MEKVEAMELEKISDMHKNVLEMFREKTLECYHPIGNLSVEDIETTVFAYVQSILDEYDTGAMVIDVALSGSRCRGMESEDSDIDVVVEYSGNIREDTLFNAVHVDGLCLGGKIIDINPITESKTGTMETYLPKVEQFLAKKEVQKDIEVTYTVAECSEFPPLGEYHDNIRTAEEAVKLYQNIPPERMQGLPSIGIYMHKKGTDEYEDDQLDLVVANRVDMYLVSYIPYVLENENIVNAMAELLYQMPHVEIEGLIPNVVADRLEEIKLERMNPIEKLAQDLDQFAYDYDTYHYNDSVDNREESVASIRMSIEAGETGEIKEWLDDIVEENRYLDDVIRAKQLLARIDHVAKICEYKPLAKVEELEEGNYNKIDGLIDTSEKNNKVEYEKKEKGVSIKNKLVEKKTEIERKMKQKECEPSKKAQAPVRTQI